MIVTAGSTNVSVYYYIVQDASATSPGEPVTGLLFSDIETGGSASYARQGAARVDLTLITLASASATHADGGFILVDDTNMPGLYRCDYPDAAFATGVDQVFLQIVVASANNAVAAPILVDITDVDLRDSVRAGLTALPNTTPGATNGIFIAGTNAATTVTTSFTTTFTGNLTGDVQGNVDGSVASVTAGVSLAAGAVTNASLAGNMEIVFETDFATNYNTTRNAWVTNFTDILGSYTAQTGDSFALIGTGGAGLGDLGGMSTAMKAEVNAECDTALTDYDGPTNAEMEARTLVAASYFDPTADAVANVTLVATTTVLTDLTVTTFAEPSSVPAATASLKDKIGWLMSLARNKLTQTATTQTLRNDADSSDIATATVSDDGTTFTRNEFS